MELRDQPDSIDSAPPHSLMAPPNGFMPPPPPRPTLRPDTVMAPPNGLSHASQAASSTQSTSAPDPDILMAPPNGTSDRTSSCACPVPCIPKSARIKLDPKTLYFPVPPEHHPSSTLTGTTDLLTLFDATYMYDRFVRPFLKASDLAAAAAAAGGSGSGSSGLVNGDHKGKDKADVVMNGTGPTEGTVQKRQKMEKSYGHFVADIGGRNSIKKDHQLETWIMDPHFQESSIRDFLKPFPPEALTQCFELQPGVLPGFDTSVWVAEEGGPKRKRKKRKQGEMAGTGVESTTVPVPLQPPSHPHPGVHSLTPIGSSKEEDHRKKKRTKLNPLQGPS